MSFPTNTVSTANLDSSTDDPALARADLLDAVQKLNTIISEGGGAGGVALLNSSSRLSSTQMPTQITVTGVQVINPTSGVVNIQDIIRLSTLTTTDLNALGSPVTGDMAMCSDGDSGDLCLAVYDGTAWKRIALGATIDQYADSAGA